MGFALNLLAKLSGVTITPDAASSPKLPKTKMQRRVTEKRRPVKYLWKPSQPLIWLSRNDAFSIGNAFEGVQIFGSNGSGKTSGSGRYLAEAYIAAGFGGLVIAAKPGDRQWWVELMRSMGRADDLYIVAPDQPWRFNVIGYDIARARTLADRIDNVMATFEDILAQAGQTFGGESQQWINAAKDMMRRAVAILAAAYDSFSYGDIIDFVAEAPESQEALKAAEFKESSFYKTLTLAEERNEAEFQWPDFARLKNYWIRDYARVPIPTRESARFVLNHLQGSLETGRAKELFGTTSNFAPEDTFAGAVIFVDLPTSESANIPAQMLFKIVWQGSLLRRGDAIRQRARPVFLWADESHLIVSPNDSRFQSLCRQAGGCTVYLTQNLSSYQQRLPGHEAKAAASALLGYFQLLIFHAQSDRETLSLARELFDKEMIKLKGVSLTDGSGSSDTTNQGDPQHREGKPNRQGGRSQETNESIAESWQEHLHDAISIKQLTTLKTGGKQNRFRVGAFVFNTGRVWKRTKTTYLYTEFIQR